MSPTALRDGWLPGLGASLGFDTPLGMYCNFHQQTDMIWEPITELISKTVLEATCRGQISRFATKATRWKQTAHPQKTAQRLTNRGVPVAAWMDRNYRLFGLVQADFVFPRAGSFASESHPN